VRDDQGKIIGVVYGSLSLARIKTLVEGAPTDAEGAGLEVVVVNDRNQLVVHPKNPLFTTREPGAWNPRYEMADSGQRIAIDPLMEAGSRYLVGSKRFARGCQGVDRHGFKGPGRHREQDRRAGLGDQQIPEWCSRFRTRVDRRRDGSHRQLAAAYPGLVLRRMAEMPSESD